MKKLLFWIGIMVILVACSTQKRITKTVARTIEVETDDSLKYELETFDSKFESWYLMHNSPAEYRSKSTDLIGEITKLKMLSNGIIKIYPH